MTATIDIWNRATEDIGPDGREGDKALHLVLGLHGDAEGDGLIAAIDHVTQSETGLHDTIAAFRFFGLDDIAEAIHSVYLEWVEVTELEDAEADDRLEAKADQVYQRLNVEERLGEALESVYAERPTVFAAV